MLNRMQFLKQHKNWLYKKLLASISLLFFGLVVVACAKKPAVLSTDQWLAQQGVVYKKESNYYDVLIPAALFQSNQLSAHTHTVLDSLRGVLPVASVASIRIVGHFNRHKVALPKQRKYTQQLKGYLVSHLYPQVQFIYIAQSLPASPVLQETIPHFSGCYLRFYLLPKEKGYF